MAEPIYGRFDEATYQRRGNDPHLERDGQRYRITELVPRMDGGANYQAVLDPVMVQQPFVILRREDVDDAQGMRRAIAEQSEAAPDEEVETWPEVDLDKLIGPEDVAKQPAPVEQWKPPEFPPLPPPPLKTWAKRKGLWAGRGPVSNKARAAYAKEFGDAG